MSNVPMTRPEELLALHETPYFHSSTFTELDDGRILHAAGTTFTTSDDGGITWSEPFERRDADGAPVGGSGTSLVRLSGRGVGLLALKQNAEEARRGIHHLVFWRSPDGGETWERPVQVTPPGLPAHAYQDVLLRTSSGRIVVPVYGMLGQRAGPSDVRPPFSGKLIGGQWVSTAAHFFDPRFSFVYVCYSDDDGRTWQRNRDGELVILHDWNATYSYVNEPSVAEVSPGRLLMVMRTGLGRLFQSWSEDNGETWSRPAPTSLAATTTPAQIRSIPATGSPAHRLEPGDGGGGQARLQPDAHLGGDQSQRGQRLGVLPERRVHPRDDARRAGANPSGAAGRILLPAGRGGPGAGSRVHHRRRHLRPLVLPFGVRWPGPGAHRA